MSAARNRRPVRTAMFAALLAVFATTIARADEPPTLAQVVERAVAYDAQVRSAVAVLDAARLRASSRPVPGEAAPRLERVMPVRQPEAASAVKAEPAEPVTIDAAERALQRSREDVAARATVAALELQRHERLVEQAQRRGGDKERLVQVQADRLAALARLEALAGALPAGVAPFDWPADGTPAADAEERHARQLADVREQAGRGQLLRLLAEVKPQAAFTAPVADAAAPVETAAAETAPEVAFAVWLGAWRSKDVARYLASYTPDYKPAGMDAQQWRAQRTARLGKVGNIHVDVEAAQWDRIDAKTARVRFVQRYESEDYVDVVDKTVVFRLTADGWRIVAETARPMPAEHSPRVARR